MFRSFYKFGDKNAEIGSTIELSPDESRHLCGALRAVCGNKVDIFDLTGEIRACKLVEASSKHALLKVLSYKEIPTRSSDIFIAQCLPKGKTFEDIVRSAVETGSAGIFPILSEHTEVKIDAKDSEKKLIKWQEKVIEYIKQSGNFFPFRIAPAQKISDFFKDEKSDFDIKIVASLRGNAIPILDAINNADELCGKKRPIKVALLIGPEGDLSEAEYDRAEAVGFIPATLGKTVMKCDTAATFAMSVCSAYFASAKK